tara:strand:+ start:578 stop:703 length:126 start_codon:yes stop_codon:yes gene_type:complete
MGGVISFALGCGITYVVMTNPEIGYQVGDLLSMVGSSLKGK